MLIYLAFNRFDTTQLQAYIQPIKPKQIKHILGTTALEV